MMSRSTLASLLFAGIVLAACQGSQESAPPIAEGRAPARALVERCGVGVRDDASVAKAAGLSLEGLEQLKTTRALDNAAVCTMPHRLLAGAIRMSQHPKADRPGEWARFRAMQQADDSGTVKPDGLIQAIAQR